MKVLRLSAICVLTIGLLSAANRVSAQEEAPSQFEHIEGLAPFVGSWTAEVPEGEGDGPMSLTCRLTGNRSYLRMEVSMPGEDGGRRQTIATLLIGRDHANDQVSLWAFWPDRQTQAKVDVGDGAASFTATGMRFDGRMASSDVAMKVDGDELTVNVTNSKQGDETLDDQTFTFTRREGRGGRGRRGGRGGQ